MKREVKFRAWEKSLKEMIRVESIDFERKMINVQSAWRTFNEIELMHYTGLKDKNDKDIYEGDILKSIAYAINKQVVGTVKYNGDLAQYYLDVDINKRIVFLGLINNIVIGNIHENHELLNS